MAEVKWIKLATNIFDNRKIRQIECLPDGDAIIVVWVKLLCLAGNINDSGFVYFTKEIPYTDQMLAAQFNRPLTTVQIALKTFQQFGMIEIIDNVLHISNWEKYQNIEGMEKIREQNRLRQKKWYDKQKALPNVRSNANLTQPNATEEDKEEDKEKEEEYSFIHSVENESFSSDDFSANEGKRRQYLQGSLGKGVVLLSDEQMNDLLDKLSLEEFDHYVSVVADCELKGKPFKKKTHYQAILDMAAKDRKIR